MSYEKSPRPNLTGPTAIAYQDVTRYVWGDRESGEVADWIYVSSERIHQLVFGLAPGGWFRHSDSHRTVFAADELYYVLSGTLVLNNPQTGEVHRAEAGEAVFFRRDTWHHGYSFGPEPLRVLEYFAPPPATGAAGDYARMQSDLETRLTFQDQWVGRWPLEREPWEQECTMHVVRRGEALVRLEGDDFGLLVEIWLSTEHLTAGSMTLLPGRSSDVRTHAGDLALLVQEGQLWVRAGDGAGRVVATLEPDDGFYLPAGVPRQFFNYGDKPARWMFGVAPAYLPVGS